MNQNHYIVISRQSKSELVDISGNFVHFGKKSMTKMGESF